MKFQPKRFVVEVKRGTSRAAFASPDPASDRFSSAEALLFSGAGKAEAKIGPSSMPKRDASSGRVLRSLVEPPPPVVEDPAPAVRRGRKPGSKNKPKAHLAEAAPLPGPDALAERPRRGRKPGSKNKPKVKVGDEFPSVAAGTPSASVEVMQGYGFAGEGTTGPDAEASPTIERPGAFPGGAKDEGAPRTARARLRERSTILKRYVLDTEPRPGQPGALRARRLARAAAGRA